MNNEVKITRATARTITEWAKLYEDKTGDKAELPAGFKLYFLPERGFAMYKPDETGKIMLIYRVCGDAKFWHDVAEIIAYQLGLKCFATIITRNVKAYIRFWNWTIVEETTIDSQKRFLCHDNQGREVIITHKGIQKNGEPSYWCTQYLQKGLV